MLREKTQLDLVFVPWGTGDVDQHVVRGTAWLRRQAGRPAVFVPAKGNYERNGTLPRLLPGIQVLTERNRHREHWSGGPLLVCWPTEKMLGLLSDGLAGRLTAACVLEWGEAPYQRAWLTARGAVDLTTGRPAAGTGLALPPVVHAAMRQLNQRVNHANGLGGQYDRGLAIATLTTLVRHGHRFDIDDLCAWALANGFTASEVERLRDFGAKALRGHRFQVTGSGLLPPDIVAVWQAEAHDIRGG